jgi:chromosomal replication initiation ATPase DnaA
MRVNVKELTGYTLEELQSRRRTREISTARMFLCWAIRLEGFTYYFIGKILRREHSTVMYYCRRFEELLKMKDGLALSLITVNKKEDK